MSEPDIPLPPEAGQDCVGYGDFLAVGRAFVEHFKNYAGLTPTCTVADIGCGFGRMALPMIDFLDAGAGGRYVGIDVYAPAIAWCQEQITGRAAHFEFEHVNVYNGTYNPDGEVLGDRLVLPVADESCDLVVMASVFTHLLPSDVMTYVREVARILKPGGRLFGTWFLLSDESRAGMSDGRSDRVFTQDGEEIYSVLDPADKELGVAYPEDWVVGCLASHGLEIREPRLYGWWSGREPHLDYQDALVVTKAGG